MDLKVTHKASVEGPKYVGDSGATPYENARLVMIELVLRPGGLMPVGGAKLGTRPEHSRMAVVAQN